MKYALPALLTFLAFSSHAADIHVLASPAARPAMTAVTPRFEEQSGDRVVFDYQDGDLADIASRDERIDAVIAPVAQMGVLARADRILPDTRRTLGRSAPTVDAPQGVVLVIAALRGGDREEPARALSAYLTLPETVAALRRSGLYAP